MILLKIFQRSRKLYRFQAAQQNVNFVKRKSSAYKRPQLSIPHNHHLQALKIEIFQQRSELSHNEWEELRNDLISKYRHINNNNIDAVIVGLCKGSDHVALAKSYMNYLQKTNKEPNIATIARLLRVYNEAYHTKGGHDTSLSSEEQRHILDVYAKLRKCHEIFDATTCENLICGLVCTTEWRKGLELLKMIKLTSTPSITAYTELTIKAFSTGDLDLGWRLLEQSVTQQKVPKCEVYLAYLKYIANEPDNFKQNLTNLFLFLEKYELIITIKVAEYIIKNFNIIQLTARATQIDQQGKCSCCQIHLQRITISDAQYAKLSNSFLNKVLIRGDIFQKSTPEEVERFRRFVTQTAPYDCVIDGLNVAYSVGAKNPKVLASSLANVVKHFKTQNKHVLVLGRLHMNKWPKDTMQYIRKNAKLFLTNDLSQDDPFLLYATLRSGQSTDFFSRDMMRSHAFLLGEELRTIFRRWQQEHQYSLITRTENGRILIKEPIRYLLCTHRVQDTWHVPYKESYSISPATTFEVPESWLCIKFNKSK